MMIWIGSRSLTFVRVQGSGRPQSSDGMLVEGLGGKGQCSMKRNHVLGVALLAVFAFGVLTASASAVTFLLALWLFNGANVTSLLLTESTGELELINKNAGKLGLTAKVLCSGTFDGWVGPESLDENTELLSLAGVAISSIALTGTSLSCANTENCEKPEVWADGLPGRNRSRVNGRRCGRILYRLTVQRWVLHNLYDTWH